MSKLSLIIILIALSACRDDSKVEACISNIFADEITQSRAYYGPLIFVTEETRDSCYAYAINYVANQQHKYNKNYGESSCYQPEDLLLVYQSVVETSSKLIHRKTDLSLNEVSSYVFEHCIRYDRVLEREVEIKSVDSFNVEGDSIIFQFSDEEGNLYEGTLFTSTLVHLACPLYSIECYVNNVGVEDR